MPKGLPTPRMILHPLILTQYPQRLSTETFLLLLRATLLVLRSGLLEHNGGAGSSVAMLLLHSSGLGGRGLGELGVDIHRCITISQPLDQTMKRSIGRPEGSRLTLVGGGGFLGCRKR